MTGASSHSGVSDLPGFTDFSSATIELAGRRFLIRRAASDDVPGIVALLRDDSLGAGREGTGAEDAEVYQGAFRLIDADPNQLLVAIEETTAGEEMAARGAESTASGAAPVLDGTLQLTLMPSLSRRGTIRLQIEAVRIGSRVQGLGLGTAVFEWAHETGRRFGASLAQLTTDKSRTDAQRFYSRLGYEASHEGLKRTLG